MAIAPLAAGIGVLGCRPESPGLPAKVEVTCHEVHEKLADFLNGVLDSDTAQHFRSHMANCEHCRTTFSEARRAIRRFLAGTEPGADAKDAAR